MADDQPAPVVLEQEWVNVQKKTFTKWMNSHLRKKGFPAVEDAQLEFETGITLMNLINALYGISTPKHNKNPKLRPHKLDNITLALGMVEQAKIKTNFLKSVHLVDKDLKMILGMLWAIILDFQIKGISVEELTAKEGLLLWCQKKTHGYRDVKVDNFTTSWQNGLAFCALIHRHRPDLLDYEPLDKANAAENLELAFRIAEEHLGIARLLDVQDLTNVARPDERSVMTYVSEYFHCFSAQNVKEKSALRIQKFVRFNQNIEQLEQQYQSGANDLLSWIGNTIDRLNDRQFGNSKEESQSLFEQHKKYLSTEKPPKVSGQLDFEGLYANIQTELSVYGRVPYNVPSGLSSDDIDRAWEDLEKAERLRGAAVRDNMFRFITKRSSTIDPEQLKEFEASFRHFDKDGSGYLDRMEFKAALSALGISFNSDDAFNRIFLQVSEGNDKISKEQFLAYLISLAEDKDTPDQIKASFQMLADQSNVITAPQLNVQPLSTGEVSYLTDNMPEASGNAYDYDSYVNQSFK